MYVFYCFQANRTVPYQSLVVTDQQFLTETFMIQFRDLEQRYGVVAAFALLIEMERHVKLNSTDLAAVDPELRIQQALERMNENTAAAA